EGFLPSLGVPFLTRLYRRVVRAPGSFLLVATGDDGVVGFIAGTGDTGRLYRDFLLRDGAMAAARAAPRLVRSWRRVLETLRYGTADGAVALPPAELLAVAVSPASRGQGAGRLLVEAFVAELERRRVAGARVVVGAGNGRAIGLYRACGVRPATTIGVHRRQSSEALVVP